MKMINIKNMIVAGAMVSLMTGCAQPGPEAKEDALIGAAGGALVGQLVGGDTAATLIGAGVGALAGGAYGHSKDEANK
jgi:hypothetical protein